MPPAVLRICNIPTLPCAVPKTAPGQVPLNPVHPGRVALCPRREVLSSHASDTPRLRGIGVRAAQAQGAGEAQPGATRL
jgi:hypothetical protein